MLFSTARPLKFTNPIDDLTSAVTTGGVTTLTSASTSQQRFTGTLAQTVRLPNAATIDIGQSYTIYNDCSSVITAETDIAQLVKLLVPGQRTTFTKVGQAFSITDWSMNNVLDSDAVFDSAAIPNYPLSASAGVWYGVGTAANGSTTTVTIGNTAAAYAGNSVAVGYGSVARPDITCVGVNNITTEIPPCVLIGKDNDSANFGYDVLIGSSISRPTGATTVAIGSSITSLDFNGSLLGRSVTMTGSNAVAVGALSSSSGVAFGRDSDNDGSFAFGISIGVESSAKFVDSTAIGYKCTASNFTTIALGPNALAGAGGNICIGDSAAAAFGSENSVVIGAGAGSSSMTGIYNVVLGSGAGTALTTGNSNVFIGPGANASSFDRYNSVVIGAGITSTQDNGLFIRHRGPAAFVTNAAGFLAGTNELVEVSSSIRTKTNIRDLEQCDPMLLRPVRYEPLLVNGLTQSDIRENIGLIAEEVHAAIPALVVNDLEGQPGSVLYDRLLVVLLQQLRAARAKLDEVKARGITKKVW